ncbi:MAG: response regulator [Verrucomicrobiota bacterium]
MSSSKLRILIADDHTLVRIGLRASIEMEPDFQIVAEAGTGEQTLAQYRKYQPDVALIDLRMPGCDGIQTTATLCREFPQARIIVISTFKGGDDILRAMQAGAKTYLPKSVQREELIKAIRAIAKGESYLPNIVASRLAERLRRPDLTARELEVLRLVAAGNSNKDIATALSIEVGTVKLHVGKILEKLHARDRTEAATMAIQAGIVWLD